MSEKKTIKKKEFNILDLKKKVETVTAYKEDRYIPFSYAVKDALRIEGLPMGCVHQIVGHSNSGKSTWLFEVATSAQKIGVLPIFIITENKFDWDHLELIGFDRGKVVDKDVNGLSIYDGFFIYKDGFKNIEDLFLEINKIIDLQDKGEIPFDIIFLVDSFGSLSGKMNSEVNPDGSLKGGNMQDATVYSSLMGKGMKSRIGMSRKQDSPYTNTILAANQGYIKPAMVPMGQPKLVPKGGEAMTYSSTYIFRTGGIMDSGLQKVSCIVSGKKVKVGDVTRVAIEKNHENYFTIIEEKIFLTPHGFLKNDKDEIEKYKNKMRSKWEERIKETEERNINVDLETGEILNNGSEKKKPIKAEV